MLKLILQFLASIFRWLRRSLLLIGCVFFFTTNLLTLTSGFVQSALSASLGMLGLSSIYSVLDSTIQRQKTTIRKQKTTIRKQKATNRKLNSAYKEASKGKTQLLEEKGRLSKSLDEEKAKSKEVKRKLGTEKSRTRILESGNEKLRATNAAKTKTIAAKTRTIKANNAAVKSIGGQVTRRTMKSAAINVAAIPFESVPWVGAGVIAVVTGIELHMTCDNIKDMNQIYASMGIQPEEDPGRVERTCLGYISHVDSIVETVGDTINMIEVQEKVDSILANVGIGDE